MRYFTLLFCAESLKSDACVTFTARVNPLAMFQVLSSLRWLGATVLEQFQTTKLEVFTRIKFIGILTIHVCFYVLKLCTTLIFPF